MREIFDFAAWRSVLVSSGSELGTRVASFLPNLLGALLILVVGWVVSRIVRSITTRALHRLGLDRAADRVRLTETLRLAGTTEVPSRIAGRFLYWLLMLVFLLSAVDMLGLSAVTSTIDRLIGYLPNVFAAVVIIVVGLVIGRFARGLVSSGAAVVNVGQAARLGTVVNGIIVLVLSVLAIEQLGIATELLVTLIAVLLGAACLTMGFAFALGARQLVAHILAGHYLRQSLIVGGMVEVNGRRGEVERIGPIDTMFRGDETRWSMPNAALLEEIVVR